MPEVASTGGTGTACGPPLQTGKQGNSAHPGEHQPHPMETGHTDGPTFRWLKKAGLNAHQTLGEALDDLTQSFSFQTLRFFEDTTIPQGQQRPSGFLQARNLGFGPFPQEDIDQQTTPLGRKEQVT